MRMMMWPCMMMMMAVHDGRAQFLFLAFAQYPDNEFKRSKQHAYHSGRGCRRGAATRGRCWRTASHSEPAGVACGVQRAGVRRAARVACGVLGLRLVESVGVLRERARTGAFAASSSPPLCGLQRAPCPSAADSVPPSLQMPSRQRLRCATLGP